ncbi:predicted protein [Sclerotinia sclerotiorum 1980 UF-70]|uniref:Uncharacterized protein n=1 Tax=Sclerotinia sclerotiorum (strain ATCC 18683 / 1980 / Ss-1) TaxID=665079 RepID=A7E722_SCLS1|nr:predicted protein [Sclerotinia sclerotiorum 1980 UF-70]EDN96174.1 predicted protein [Sclerotinia sclerotiorum 1980 UF-70]
MSKMRIILQSVAPSEIPLSILNREAASSQNIQFRSLPCLPIAPFEPQRILCPVQVSDKAYWWFGVIRLHAVYIVRALVGLWLLLGLQLSNWTVRLRAMGFR